MPNALDRKYANAPADWRWQWVFPQEKRWKNPKTGEEGRHYTDESLVQKAVKDAVRKRGKEAMEEPDIQKYVLDQAKIEIEHARSWPTKAMAFYVAINFGLVGASIALKNKGSSFAFPCVTKTMITILFLILAYWVMRVLWNTHKNYLTYRNLQIRLQQIFLANRKEEFGLPDDWFRPNEVRASTRLLGWGLYVYIVAMITGLAIAGLWLFV